MLHSAIGRNRIHRLVVDDDPGRLDLRRRGFARQVPKVCGAWGAPAARNSRRGDM